MLGRKPNKCAAVDWLDAYIALRAAGAVLVVFLQCWRKICTILQPMGSKAIPEEMSQTLLPSKKQGIVDLVHAANIIKPTQTRINREKYNFLV